MCVELFVMFPYHGRIFIPDIGNLGFSLSLFFFLVNVARCLSTSLSFSKNQLLCHWLYSFSVFNVINFCSYLFIFFLLFSLGLFCFSLRLLNWDYFFLQCGYKYFHLSISCSPHIPVCFTFIFIQFNVVFYEIISVELPLWLMNYLERCCLVTMCLKSFLFSFCYWFHCGWRPQCTILIVHSLMCVLRSRIWFIMIYILWILKTVCSAVIGRHSL